MGRRPRAPVRDCRRCESRRDAGAEPPDPANASALGREAHQRTHRGAGAERGRAAQDSGIPVTLTWSGRVLAGASALVVACGIIVDYPELVAVGLAGVAAVAAG